MRGARAIREMKERWVYKDVPVERLWTDGGKVIPLLPPRPPTGVLKTHAVGDGVLLAGHAAP